MDRNNRNARPKQALLQILCAGLLITGPPLFGSGAPAACEGAQDNDRCGPRAICLVLQIPHRTFRDGQPIDALAFLENVSDKPFYVGIRTAGFFGSVGLHDISLTITDDQNREVQIGHGAGDWIWKPNTSVREKLEQAYTSLAPRMIHGIKDRLTLRLRPGHYRFTATYREIEALRWTEADRSSLPVPVWTQPLTSNTIRITVIPRR